jgi:cation:H+ antiporter
MDWMIVLYLLGGFIILMAGAEGLVRGASRLAAALGISPLVIGLTVVAFGTSAPELAVSVQSAYRGTMDVAVGNVIGSNIFNILLILGVSAVITPLIVNSQLLRLDVPLMILVSFIFYYMALDGVVSRLDGLLLFGGLLLYIWWSIRKSRQEQQEVKEEYAEEYSQKDSGVVGYIKNITFVVVGLAMLVVGSDWLVEGATSLARLFNVSDLIIGLTIVALGTSLPELATSIVAAIRKERDIAVGNVVGSNFFNIMAVIGLSGLVAPAGVQVSAAALQLDIPVMLFVSVLAFPILFIDGRISRWEGALMLVLLAAYITYLVFISIPYPSGAQVLSTIMLWFVVPATTIVIGINVVLQLQRRKRQ